MDILVTVQWVHITSYERPCPPPCGYTSFLHRMKLLAGGPTQQIYEQESNQQMARS